MTAETTAKCKRQSAEGHSVIPNAMLAIVIEVFAEVKGAATYKSQFRL